MAWGVLNCHEVFQCDADVVGRNTTESSEWTYGGSRRLWEQYRRGFRLLDSDSGHQAAGSSPVMLHEEDFWDVQSFRTGLFFFSFVKKLELKGCLPWQLTTKVWPEHQTFVVTYYFFCRLCHVSFLLCVLQPLVKQESFSSSLAVTTCALFSFLVIVGPLPTSCFNICVF